MINPLLVLVGLAQIGDVLSAEQVLELDASSRRTSDEISTIVRVARFAASAT